VIETQERRAASLPWRSAVTADLRSTMIAAQQETRSNWRRSLDFSRLWFIPWHSFPKMKETELRNTLAELLTEDVLNKRGQTLYSGIDTLMPGDFYFVGFNPAARARSHSSRSRLSESSRLTQIR
jgi:hypothetical protein